MPYLCEKLSLNAAEFAGISDTVVEEAVVVGTQQTDACLVQSCQYFTVCVVHNMEALDALVEHLRAFHNRRLGARQFFG